MGSEMCIGGGTKGEGEKSAEDYWVSATRSQAVKSLRTGNGFPLFGELIV